MIILLGIPVILVGGYYYIQSNKKKVIEKALDMYASIVVYSKDKLKYIKNNDFVNNYVKMIYYNKNIKNECSVKFLFNSITDNDVVINIDEIIKQNDELNNQHSIIFKKVRLLFNYQFESKEYLQYISRDKVFQLKNGEENIEYTNTYPLLSKQKFDNFKDNKVTTYFKNNKENVTESFYVLLNSDLKDIESVKLYNKETEEYEVDVDNKLKNLFTQLKGPFNDWGLLSLNVVRNKWIYEDFNIDKKYKIIVKQGLYLNNEYDLESDLIEIEYNDEFVKLPTIYELFLKKIKENNLEINIL